jgi:periplasmic protein CpxP/Spy
MKRIVHQFPYLTALAVAAMTLLATIALASASPAHADSVEARIKELHAKLKITQAQEDLWTNVTKVMRDNAKTEDALIKARFENAKTMTAIDDLKSYGDVADARAEGLKKFIPVFGALYASMSDAQKQNADTIFRSRNHTRSKNH